MKSKKFRYHQKLGLHFQIISVNSIVTADEEDLILNLNIWVTEHGLPEGEFGYEIIDSASGELIAVIDLAWPEGLQEGFGAPLRS